MKTTSPSLTAPRGSPAALGFLSVPRTFAETESIMYYYEVGRVVLVSPEDMLGLSEPQIEDLCRKIVGSLEAVKAEDRRAQAHGEILKQYVKNNYAGLDIMRSTAEALRFEEMPSFTTLSNPRHAARQAVAVETHNALAIQGIGAIISAGNALLRASGMLKMED